MNTRLLRFITLFCILFAQQHATAQVNKKAGRDSLFEKYATISMHGFDAAKPYYVIKWQGLMPRNIKVTRQLNENTAIIVLNDEDAFRLVSRQVRIALARDDWKFSPSAEQFIQGSNKDQEFIISSFNIDSLLPLLQVMTTQLKIVTVNRPSHSVLIKTTVGFLLNKLLSLKEVIFIDVRHEPHTEINIIGYDRSFNGINALDYTIPGANGRNIVAGVKEQKMDASDLDLYKRVLSSSIASADVTQHATTIASIIGGAGNSFYDGRGMANACTFFPSSFDNLFADDANVLNASKVTVQNHSYGTIVQQFYGAEAVSYDVQTWENKNLIHVFSAGNEGTSSATEGKYANIPGFANLTGNFKMAKNVITVGAIDNKENIPPQSSSGPLYDGRLAPQLTALGPNGTSDAAAVVSGAIAVMQQVYADSNNHLLPSASLMQAVLYNTADDIYHLGIDYKTGYGLLNSFEAVRSIQHKEYFEGNVAQNGIWTKTITVPQDAAQLKITLAWTDSAAAANNNKALINDLDLEVQYINTGVIYKPWVLNMSPHVDSLSELPIRKRDSLNTAEQVSIQLPAPGNYSINVRGTSVSSESLPFHTAWHVDTLNTFLFTSPQHASDVDRENNPYAFIRWKAFVADTNQVGNLYISYNKGITWELLKESLKIYANKYQWQIKDTNSTAVLKMATSFGDFLSKEFILSKPVRPTVDFVCTDSFRLSWNKHVYADAYRIYALTDSPYLKHILTVNDTFLVMRRSVYPQIVYAVEPVLSNGLSAERSIAIDINLQGVKCFYKTLYYNLLAENKLNLTLELSAPDYTDSILFEQITTTGQLIQSYEGLKVNSSSVYTQIVNDVPAGTSYWRAKIKLKSGTVVYSETITVLTSGKKYILFYPNPVAANRQLNYILQQDIPLNNKLLLFDVTGRLVKTYDEMPNSINTHGLTPGMFIYKLFSSDNRLLEAGKLVVQ